MNKFTRGKFITHAAKESDLLIPGGAHYKGGFDPATLLPDGVGTLFAPDGSEMASGHWKAGAQHGIGRITVNGDRYEGLLSNGAPDGVGSMHFSSGAVYEGEWAGGAIYGLGVQWAPTGEIVGCGNWEQGKLEKPQPVSAKFIPSKTKLSDAAKRDAVLLFPNGEYYAGEVNSKNERHGAGRMHKPDGQLTRQGNWRGDIAVA